MFWRKEKTVRVELVSPRLILEGQQTAASNEAGAPSRIESNSVHLDSVLKLAALFAAIVNGALLTFGYMRYLALMELFGIARSEVAFSVSDLLAYGYGDVLNRVFSSGLAQLIFGGGIGLVAVLFVALFWTGRPSWKKEVVTYGAALLLAILPTIPMLMSYYPAKTVALSLAAKHLKIDESDLSGISKRHEIKTSEGLLSGDVLLATSEYTYLLAGPVVYKIKASNNEVVRKTYLEAKLNDGRE